MKSGTWGAGSRDSGCGIRDSGFGIRDGGTWNREADQQARRRGAVPLVALPTLVAAAAHPRCGRMSVISAGRPWTSARATPDVLSLRTSEAAAIHP